MGPYLGAIAHRSRHVGCGLWIDSQSIADVSSDLRKQLAWWYVFGLADKLNGDALRGLGGDELREAAKAAALLAHRGEKGWHVRLEALYPAGPFVLVRSTPDGREERRSVSGKVATTAPAGAFAGGGSKSPQELGAKLGATTAPDSPDSDRDRSPFGK
jgi:hypothetical protein